MATLKTVAGLARTSIKTVDGTARASLKTILGLTLNDAVFQAQVPAGAYSNQTGAFQAQVPGGVYMNETVT